MWATVTDLLNVDLTRGTVTREPLSADLEPLGGHGLTSAIVNQEVNPEADPLGPGNMLVHRGRHLRRHEGPQRGPALRWRQEPADWRHQGGQLRRLGRACAGRARPARHQGRRSGRGALGARRHAPTAGSWSPAPELEGLGSFDTADRLWKRYGDKVSLICTGPAGEQGARAAAVLVTTSDHYMRAAARGGLGAVMGSKKLKAVVIDGAGGPGITVADPVALKAASRALATGIRSHPAMAALEALGSAFLVNVTQSMGCLATKNFSAGKYEDVEDITGEHMVELISARPNGTTKHSCMKGCIINCSQVYTDEAGEVITSGVEFETIGLMGSNCQINDLDQIARLDHLCDDLGLDTMEIGAAMGVAMEGGLPRVG